jgi:hypothetical protein
MTRWQPPAEQVIEARPRRPRWPLVVLLLAFAAVGAAGIYLYRKRLSPPGPDRFAHAMNVRSDVTGHGDSIDVVVTWEFTDGALAGFADSVRLEVGVGDGSTSTARIFPNDRQADTLHLAVQPGRGTLSGYSCAAAVYAAKLTRESCTPWQFVRPAAGATEAVPPLDSSARSSKSKTGQRGVSVSRIVVSPEGQQVDPDVGGRCAAWQREHPNAKVWIDVNQRAVPACMGPNGKPTVAQFCAFAILSDGRRVVTANSAANPYCQLLFEEWARERVT